MASPQEFVQAITVQGVRADRQSSPGGVEQLFERSFADGDIQLGEWSEVADKVARVGAKLSKADVFDIEQVELLQVGERIAPATSLIDPEPVSKDIAEFLQPILRESLIGVLLVEPLGVSVRRIESQRRDHPSTDVRVAHAFVARVLERREDCAAQERDENEIVEVSCLKRRILTIVTEA